MKSPVFATAPYLRSELQMPELYDRDTIKRELLTYLAGLPHKIEAQGKESLPEALLALGNCLCWLSPMLETGPRLTRTNGENADTVYALGKQFQAIGRQLLDSPKAGQIEQRLRHLEETVEQLLAERGGVK